MKNTCEIFNKNGERAIDAKSIASLTECVMALPQTKSFYLDKNGNYTPERKALHAEIIKDFKEDVICIDKGKPIAVLMGGSPASGKSTFLKKYRPYLLSENLFKVDADEIRARLPEYKGWNATQTHEETGDIVKTLISDKNIGVPCKFDFIYDGTMTSEKKYLALIELLQEEGYEVYVVFISNIPKQVVRKRALERYQKSGRFVPMMVIDDFYKNGEDTFKQVKNKVDGYIVVDGSTFDYNIMEQGGKSLPNKRLYERLGHKIQLKKGGQMRTYKIIYKGNIRIESALNEQAAIEQAKQKLSIFYGNIPDSQLVAFEMEIPNNKFEEGGSIHENFVITATGISSQNKKDLMDMGVQLNIQGPGYYLYVKTSDKEKVINYLEMNKIEFSPQYAKGGPINETEEIDFVWDKNGHKFEVVKITDDSYFLKGYLEKTSKEYPKAVFEDMLKRKLFMLSPQGKENSNDPQFIQYNGDEIMFVPVYGTFWVNDEEFETIEQAKSYIDEGYEPKMFAKGGQTESKVIKHFKPSDFYKLGGSIEEMTPVEKFFSQLDYSQLPSGFSEYVKNEILTDPTLEFVSETDPIFVEIQNKVNSMMNISIEGTYTGMNSEINKKVANILITRNIKSEEDFIKVIRATLSDANFHIEAMAFIKDLDTTITTDKEAYSSKWWQSDSNIQDTAMEINTVSDYDGDVLENAFIFALKMNGYHSVANSLEKAFVMPSEDNTDENAETQEAINLLLELAEDQEGAEKAETLEAIELLKELLV